MRYPLAPYALIHRDITKHSVYVKIGETTRAGEDRIQFRIAWESNRERYFKPQTLFGAINELISASI
jgi:hypothetical protein